MPSRSKITPEQAQEIRESTDPVKVLARRYGLSLGQIYNIRNGHYHRNGAPDPPRRNQVGRPRIHFPQPCGCGCGEWTSPGCRYLCGHSSRVNGVSKNLVKNIPRTPEQFLEATFANCVSEDRGYVDENGIPSDCLIWQGNVDPVTGYAIAGWKGRKTTAHRLVYEALHGTLERNLDVHHKCGTRNRTCMEPSHLVAIGRAVHIRGHVSRLTRPDVEEIHRLHAEGMGSAELGERYGMNRGSIANILRGQRWADIKPASTTPE